MEITEKEKIALCVGAGLLLVAGVWFWYAGRNDVFNFGERTNRVREQLSDAGESQSRTAESLDRASDLAGSAERDNQETGQRIEQIEEGNRKLQNSERGDKEIIRGCQRILDQVRERGKAQN